LGVRSARLLFERRFAPDHPDHRAWRHRHGSLRHWIGASTHREAVRRAAGLQHPQCGAEKTGSAVDAAEVERLQSRFDSLSTRQRQVMELTVAGLSNKEIGLKLDISTKTVENHRAWVMERIGARNLADLVRMAMQVRGSRP
jgi:FixJ family two-component response regulator